MNGTGSSERDDLARRVLRDLSHHERTRSSVPGPAAPLPAPPRLSRFELLEAVGQGATAVVYRARDKVLHRDVAVKVLRECSGVVRERFRREAQSAAGLAHPNVVTVYDAGEEDQQPYLVMELVEGRPFSELLKTPGTDRRTLLSLLEKTARGVAAAHERGIVHRDLKPANILVTAGGEPKVGDFGLAHVLETRSELTRTGTSLGTPQYMAPEQVEGRPSEISPRTDVHALGAMLYEILTGGPPHRGETLADLYGRIVRDDPVPPRALVPSVPLDAQTIALKALEKEPRRRYADAREFADDLRRHLDGEPVRARPVGRLGRLGRRIRRNPLGYGLGLAAAAAGVLAVLFAVQSFRMKEEIDRLVHPNPWKPVFDGTSTACFMDRTPKGWKIEDGWLVSDSVGAAAIQTGREFEDGDVRVRFACREMSWLGFNIRLGTDPGHGVDWNRRDLNPMSGAEHELIFVCRGEEVTATLDGTPIPVRSALRPRKGTLQFSGTGGQLRIRSIDYRDPR